MARGKERQIICAACKRYCRRDKAVYIEKVVFSNPIERKDIAEKEGYQAVFKREVAYCPGCGKHLRIYEKKTQENQRNRERAMERQARQTQPVYGDSMHSRKGGYREVGQSQDTDSHEARMASEGSNPENRTTPLIPETQEPATGEENSETQQAA